MRELEGLNWSMSWVAHLGCVKGCLDYLGIEMSRDWLYGGTGHAFVMNIHEGLCPSGPTAWNASMLFRLAPNLGYRVEGVHARKDQPGFRDAQAKAWDHVRAAIDASLPCYGWELEIPEYYVIYGYDEVGYHFRGPGADEGKGPRPWEALGDTGIGMLEAYSVRPGQEADAVTVLREALRFAIKIAGNPDEWIFPGYRAGLPAYDNWIAALQEGKASDMGNAYNAGVWAECRRHAAGFLKEADLRLAEQAPAALAAAIESYLNVAAHLHAVASLYPWRDGRREEALAPVDEASASAVEELTKARAAEERGLAALAGVLAEL